MKIAINACLILISFGLGCYEFLTMENCKTKALKSVKMSLMIAEFMITGFCFAKFISGYLN